MATTTATQIQQLYVGLLGRAADQGGLNWWADQVTTGGKTLEDVRASFVTSTEYTTTYGAAATRADLVTSIYQNLFELLPIDVEDGDTLVISDARHVEIAEEEVGQIFMQVALVHKQ